MRRIILVATYRFGKFSEVAPALVTLHTRVH